MKKIGDITNTADKNGEFTDGNVAAGTPPTQLMGAWFNSVQREILNVLAKAGVPQSATKEDQLAEAITKMVASAGYLPTGYSYSKIESDGRYQPKGNYAPAGDYATNTALNNGLDKKFDKAGGNITGRVRVNNTVDANVIQVTGENEAYMQLDMTVAGVARINTRIEGKPWRNHVLPDSSGTLMQVGDGGWMRDVGVSLGGYPKLSDYRLNSIGYAYGNVSTDSFDGTNHILLNLFGYTSNAYGAQLAVTLAGKVGIRTITNNVVNPWHTMFSTANTQSDHNGNVKIPGYLERSDYPVGCPIPWPQATTPAGYLVCNGQSFNKTTYPLLAKAYPTGVLPDLRGEFLRGLDAGRGVDTGRAVLSAQGDAFRAHNHSVIGEDSGSGTAYFGRGNGSRREISKDAMNLEGGTETRPRNIAFLYIVRAA